MVTKRAAGAATLVILGAMMVLGCMVFTDTSVVKETNDPADWTPRGQDGFDQEISDKKRQDAHVESDFYDDVTPETFQEKEFGLEDSSFEDTDLSLELLQTQSKDKKLDIGIYGTYFGGELLGKTHGQPTEVEVELENSPGLDANAITLKTYALALSSKQQNPNLGATKLDTTAMGSLNVLRPILNEMAEPCAENETPRKQYEVILSRLKSQKQWHLANSIAKGMLEIIDENMRSKRGILTFATLRTVPDCAEEVTYNNEVGDDVTVSGGQVNCLKAQKAQAAGQSVFIDADRVGWSGSPRIFSNLAVKVPVYLHAMQLANFKASDIVTNTKKDSIALDRRAVSKRDASHLFEGDCVKLDGSKDYALECSGKAKEMCTTLDSCKWGGAWDGSIAP